MPEYEIRLTKEALKDLKKHPPRLKIKLKEILQNRVAIDPYSGKSSPETSVDSIPSA